MQRHGLVAVNMQDNAKGPINTYEGVVIGSTLDYIAVPAVLSNWVNECCVSEWSELNTSYHIPVSATVRITGVSRLNNLNPCKGQIKWKKMSVLDKFDN